MIRIKLFGIFLAIILVAGCSQGEAILDKVNQLLDNALEDQNTSEGEEDNNSERTDDNADQSGTDNDSEVSETDGNANNMMEEKKVDEDELEQVNDGEIQQTEEAKPEVYQDSRGDDVALALGSKSFATAVIAYEPGLPTPKELHSDANQALGEPDNSSVSLSTDGVLILEFGEAALMDGEGDDIYVFEIGPIVEATDVEISQDGTDWVFVGTASGGESSLDIAEYVEPGQQFHFVKLTSRSNDTNPDSPGADIDAVAIVNGVLK